MLTKLTVSVAATVAAGLLVAPAPTSAQVSSPSAPSSRSAAARDVIIAPGRLDTVRIGESIESAAETDYFDLDVRTGGCGVRAIWPTRKWRSKMDVYPGFEDGTDDRVGSIGVFGEGISTKEGIGIGSTVADLQEVYAEDLTGPRTNDYGQWGYFTRINRRWLGFLTDVNASMGRPGGDDEVTFIEITKGRRPGLLRDGC